MDSDDQVAGIIRPPETVDLSYDTLAVFRGRDGVVVAVAPEHVQAVTASMGKVSLIMSGAAVSFAGSVDEVIAEIDRWRAMERHAQRDRERSRACE